MSGMIQTGTTNAWWYSRTVTNHNDGYQRTQTFTQKVTQEVVKELLACMQQWHSTGFPVVLKSNIFASVCEWLNVFIDV